jgi:hypothetical protein
MTAEFSIFTFTNSWVIYLDAALTLPNCVVCCTSQSETSCEDFKQGAGRKLGGRNALDCCRRAVNQKIHTNG